MSDASETGGKNFIRAIIADDLASGRHDRIVTRFPPEPSGQLHIGHATPICLNFGIAAENPGAVCHLRFDDTNPVTEEAAFVEGIQQDIRWLGFDWGDHLHFTSDYFEALYGFALQLIEGGHAFVCDLDSEQIAERRGNLTEPGVESPSRGRSPIESRDLFQRMRAGEFESGSRVLRAKIDMASPNLTLRDPVLYRIQRETPHHRTQKEWCLYPLYDFAHALSDALEGVTHSLCSGEFYERRPLYNWMIEHVQVPSKPRQIEFARVNLSYTLLSKRRLKQLVEDGSVDGWDDPRMPTLAGLRRRGVPPAAIRNFCQEIGMTPGEGGRSRTVELGVLEHAIREELNEHAPRVMGVLDPLKLVIENLPEGEVDELECANHPNRPELGTRRVPFSRELFIERADFMEDPPKKFFRLAPGREVRLRYAYFVTCTGVVKDGDEIVEVRCRYDPATRGGDAPDGRKVKATLHWVSAAHARPAEVRLYETLFTVEDPDAGGDDGDFRSHLNPESLVRLADARVEPSLAEAEVGATFQFERQGYFCLDPRSTPERLVFNRSVTLRDTWARVSKKAGG